MRVPPFDRWRLYRRREGPDRRPEGQEGIEAQLYRLTQREKALRRKQRALRQQVQRIDSRLKRLFGGDKVSTRLHMGAYTYFDGEPRVLAAGHGPQAVRIGSYSSVGSGVSFMVEADHRVDWLSTFPFRVKLGLPGAYDDGHPSSRGDILVGSDVWIGRDARVLSGVTIGNGAVVGADTVVTRDVRPYAVVVGNPGREVRRRFSDEQIEALERIAWWEWPHERVVEAIPLLCCTDIDRFIAEYGTERG
jgi:acetyltransferase-like isoleucine patch superfamily enzyme